MFLVFNSYDELEPHDFLKRDPLNINGYVKDWDIKELDLVHAERENELVIRQQFRWMDEKITTYFKYKINIWLRQITKSSLKEK